LVYFQNYKFFFVKKNKNNADFQNATLRKKWIAVIAQIHFF